MRKHLSILFLCFTVIFNSCKKENQSILTLPPLTQEGKGTFGCLVDGNVYLPKRNPFSGKPAATAFYQFISNQDEFGFFFNVSATRESDKECEITSISINGNLVQMEENHTYKLEAYEPGKIQAEYRYNSGCLEKGITYSTNSTITGELKIIKMDKVKQIVSGTFWFDAISTEGKKVEVREGRFDMKYVQ